MLANINHLFQKYRVIDGDVYEIYDCFYSEYEADSTARSLYSRCQIDSFQIVTDSFENQLGENKVWIVYVR